MVGIESTSNRDGDMLVHAALLHRDPSALRAAVAEFADEAANEGEPVLAIAPVATLELIDDALSTSGAVIAVSDMARVGRNPGMVLPILQEWVRAGHGRRVRVLSEPMWPGRCRAEMVECLRHEALLNLVLAAVPASVLCLYDAAHLDAAALSGAEFTHPELIDELGRRPSVVYGDPLVLHRGDRWPQDEPTGPVGEHPFAGDLGHLRHAVADDPRLRALDRRRRADLVFAVNEAATNAVRHGDRAVRTRVWREDERVVSEVRSDTPIEDPLAGHRRPAPDAAGGRGLWLINQLCDLVELRSGPRGSSLRMHMRAAV